MLVLRFLAVLCVVGVVSCVAAYLVTGKREFLTYVGWIIRFALGVLLLFIALLGLERVLMPIV